MTSLKLRPGHALPVLACWAGLALAAPAEPADTPAAYTHAIPLTVSGKNAVVQLRLPPAVYLNARSASLNDLRVFDAAGRPLPFALTQPAAQPQARRTEIPVRLFPVPAVQGPGRDLRNNVEIRTSADGAVTSITTRQAGSPGAAQAGLGALVLDLGPAPVPVDALVFTLPAGVSNYQAQVELEASDDLQAWETVGYASLSWLENSSAETLSNNRMAFPARPFRYARLSWRQGAPLQFARIAAESPAASDAAPALDSIVLQSRPARFEGDLAYDSAPAIPARSLNLRFAEQNVVLPALVGHYTERPAIHGARTTKWEFVPRLQATFFRINQGGRQRISGDVAVGELHASSWVVRPQAPSAARPQLQLSWLPATVVFMASGPAPYTLAVGRDKAKPAHSAMAKVAPGFSASELQALEQALPGTPVVNRAAAGQDSGAAAAGLSARARLALLWGVLLLGVGVLGLMARKLLGQMKQSG